MIFLNRRRTIINSGTVKDPSKYWYVEKYVYGELKETIEIPLKTSVKFEAIESGYDDDTFYGWSVSGTSATRTFNNTSSYANTSAAVKSRLDSENTLKLYGIYKYSPLVSSVTKTSTGNYTLICNDSGTISATGWVEIQTLVLSSGETVSDTTSTSGVTITITDSNGKTKKTITTKKAIDTSEDVEMGDKLVFAIKTEGISTDISQKPTGTYYAYDSTVTITFTGLMCDTSIIKYRVESHTV